MPMVPFDQLPDSARVWIFGSDQPLHGATADRLLAEVDRFLENWKAHGLPLRSAREWRDDRFLVVGVDTTVEHASGCSIDGLFRSLQGLESVIGARLVGGGRVFYRGADGAVVVADRESFSDRIARGEVTRETPVYDTSITSASELRGRFEQPAGSSWTASLF